MAYNYITTFDSPNYTSGADTLRDYGMARQIEGITIHHWGDPNKNPKFEDVVNYLCRPNGNTSAHYVATGTGRQVACIISPDHTAWHSGSTWGNARTIGIELDPRCRPEDYDVAAELVADIRAAYGDVPIYWHSYFFNTQCPGVWNPYTLDELSYTKYADPIEWGKTGDKNPAPTPAPTPVAEPTPIKQDVPTWQRLTEGYVWLEAKLDQVQLWDLDTNPNYVSKREFTKGSIIQVGWYLDFNGTRYYGTDYAKSKGFKWGINAKDVIVHLKDPNTTNTAVETPKADVPAPSTKDPEGNTLPDTGKPVTEKIDYSKENNEMLKSILAIVTQILSKITSIFK